MDLHSNRKEKKTPLNYLEPDVPPLIIFDQYDSLQRSAHFSYNPIYKYVISKRSFSSAFFNGKSIFNKFLSLLNPTISKPSALRRIQISNFRYQITLTMAFFDPRTVSSVSSQGCLHSQHQWNVKT